MGSSSSSSCGVSYFVRARSSTSLMLPVSMRSRNPSASPAKMRAGSEAADAGFTAKCLAAAVRTVTHMMSSTTQSRMVRMVRMIAGTIVSGRRITLYQWMCLCGPGVAGSGVESVMLIKFCGVRENKRLTWVILPDADKSTYLRAQRCAPFFVLSFALSILLTRQRAYKIYSAQHISHIHTPASRSPRAPCRIIISAASM